MKIKKIISTRVYNRFKTCCYLFVGLMAINYLSDFAAKDVISAIADDVDLSDYGIFVNADGDLVEEGEQQLRESHYDYGVMPE